MRVLKKYENFREFDIDFAVAKIKHFYTENMVKDLFDDELQNWISEDEIGEGWKDIYDWFYDNYKEESLTNEVVTKKRQLALAVSDMVVEQIIDWYENNFEFELTQEQKDLLSERIIETYEGIDPKNW